MWATRGVKTQYFWMSDESPESTHAYSKSLLWKISFAKSEVHNARDDMHERHSQDCTLYKLMHGRHAIGCRAHNMFTTGALFTYRDLNGKFIKKSI